jgi:hypothetical protein
MRVALLSKAYPDDSQLFQLTSSYVEALRMTLDRLSSSLGLKMDIEELRPQETRLDHQMLGGYSVIIAIRVTDLGSAMTQSELEAFRNTKTPIIGVNYSGGNDTFDSMFGVTTDGRHDGKLSWSSGATIRFTDRIPFLSGDEIVLSLSNNNLTLAGGEAVAYNEELGLPVLVRNGKNWLLATDYNLYQGPYSYYISITGRLHERLFVLLYVALNETLRLTTVPERALVVFQIDDMAFYPGLKQKISAVVDWLKSHPETRVDFAVAPRSWKRVDQETFNLYYEYRDRIGLLVHSARHVNPDNVTHQGEFYDYTADKHYNLTFQRSLLERYLPIWSDGTKRMSDIFVPFASALDITTSKVLRELGFVAVYGIEQCGPSSLQDGFIGGNVPVREGLYWFTRQPPVIGSVTYVDLSLYMGNRFIILMGHADEVPKLLDEFYAGYIHARNKVKQVAISNSQTLVYNELVWKEVPLKIRGLTCIIRSIAFRESEGYLNMTTESVPREKSLVEMEIGIDWVPTYAVGANLTWTFNQEQRVLRIEFFGTTQETVLALRLTYVQEFPSGGAPLVISVSVALACIVIFAFRRRRQTGAYKQFWMEELADFH